MTPQFTTPCYVRIDDAQQRKEVCDKLNAMGYNFFGQVYDPERDTVFTHLYDEQYKYTNDPVYEINKNHRKEIFPDSSDCGTNIDLFLDIAGMRKDTDLNQWVIDSDGNWHKCPDDVAQEYFDAGYDCGLMPKMTCRKATATEIINQHKQKG